MAAEFKLVDGTVLTTEAGTDFREVARAVSTTATTDATFFEVKTEQNEVILIRPEHVVWVRQVADAGEVPLVAAV